MQRDRVARAHFQDVRRAAIKVSPYHVLGSTGYLVATRHKWAPAEYRTADRHTRLIPAQWPCVADRRQGIAVADGILGLRIDRRAIDRAKERCDNRSESPDLVLCYRDTQRRSI